MAEREDPELYYHRHTKTTTTCRHREQTTIEIKNKALEQNYRPLVIDGIRKIINGDTTLDELNRQLILY